MRSTTAVIAGVGTIFLLLCATSAAATPDACTLLTQKQVSDVLGVQVGPGEHLMPNNTAMCVWTELGHKTTGNRKVVLSLYTQIGSRSPVDRFNTAKTPINGIEKTPVSGVGDEAFYSTAPGLETLLVVRKGNTPFHIDVHGFPAEQLKEKEKILAADIVAKL